MTLQDQINASSENVRQLLQGMYDEVCDAVHVSGEWLPKRYRDDRYSDNGNSVSRIEEIYQNEVAERIERMRHRQEIERRVELYSEQWDASETLEMEEFVPNGHEFSNAQTDSLF